MENKLYHGAIIAAGLSAIITGVFMMSRVRTVFFPRNPYLFSDMTWGMMYVLHGLAGVGLIALVMVHVYFGVRPEKRPITKSMIFGWMSRDFYLKEHDPKRWVVETLFVPIFFGIELQGIGRARANRCCLKLGIVVRPWKSAMSSCWPTQPRVSARDEGSKSGGQVREFLQRAVLKH